LHGPCAGNSDFANGRLEVNAITMKYFILTVFMAVAGLTAEAQIKKSSAIDTSVRHHGHAGKHHREKHRALFGFLRPHGHKKEHRKLEGRHHHRA
jgi:hypothetical protein